MPCLTQRILERMEQIFMIKENYIYVGIDLHKETHTAVMIDCYNQKLGEITFPNRPADFPKLVTKVKKCNTDGKEVVYGLENAYGYGRALAVWLIDKGYLVKDVNTAISHRQAKHRGAMYRKSDSDDVEAIALAISLDRVTDLNAPTHQGIDGVYYNLDGHPPYIIGEAKYGSSRLAILADGTPQMSDKWIIDRLENAVGEGVANDIKMEMILNPDNVGSILVHVSSNGEIDITKLIDGIKQ